MTERAKDQLLELGKGIIIFLLGVLVTGLGSYFTFFQKVNDIQTSLAVTQKMLESNQKDKDYRLSTLEVFKFKSEDRLNDLERKMIFIQDIPFIKKQLND